MKLDIENTQLLVVDIQGKLAEIVDDAENVLKNSEILIKTAQALNIPILWVEQNPDGLGETHPKLKTILEIENQAFSKHTFSALKEDKIREKLESYSCSQILVCGIEAHVCVYQTVMDLLGYGYRVHLIEDAVSSRNKNSKDIAIAKMRENGAIIDTTEMAIFELLKTHQHPKFRELLKLLK
ncbi:MAG: isochorismatase family protein [Cruoricaptor ignavus]|nr:isochorismatase family protein [Cruoricaptor ignavus]